MGGGYSDSDELPKISLEWMIQELSSSYKFGTVPVVNGKATALAHWSMGDRPGNARSKCVDRQFPDKESVHSSYDTRVSAGPVPIRVKGSVRNMKYPLKCADTLDNKAEFSD